MIIEFEDLDAPECLFKYHYRFISRPPILHKKDSVMVKVEKVIEVPLQAPPKAYISHKCKKNEELGFEFK
jgi:hypothetical protein